MIALFRNCLFNHFFVTGGDVLRSLFRLSGGEVLRSLDRMSGGNVLRSLGQVNGGIVLRALEDVHPDRPKRTGLDTMSGVTLGSAKKRR